jgi:hypothetical protein
MQGGQDAGGGGELPRSKAEEVVSEIQRTKAFLLSAKGSRFLSAYLADYLKKDTSQSTMLAKVLEKLLSPRDWAEKNHGELIGYKTLEEYLNCSELEYFPNDTIENNCSKDATHPYPDAYVSELKYGAKVCFNVQQLRRLPFDSLFPHLISLWLHEITHLNGFGEGEAKAMEKVVAALVLEISQPEVSSLIDEVVSTLGYMVNNLFDVFATVAIPEGPARSLTPDEGFKLGQVRGALKTLAKIQPSYLKLEANYSLNDSLPDIHEQVNNLKNWHNTIDESLSRGLPKVIASADVKAFKTDLLEMLRINTCAFLAAFELRQALASKEYLPEEQWATLYQKVKSGMGEKCRIN